MVFVAICAVISGAEGWSDIVDFAQAKLDWLRLFVRLYHGIPVDDTFALVLSVLSPNALTECLLAWTQDLAEQHPGEIIALDGKTARRSQDRKNQRGPLHLVRAWATTQGVALGMVKTGRNPMKSPPYRIGGLIDRPNTSLGLEQTRRLFLQLLLPLPHLRRMHAKVLGNFIDRLQAANRLKRNLRLELSTENLAFLLTHNKPQCLTGYHLK